MCYFPSGKSNFKSIRTEKYVYVDKTKYIEKLENARKQSIHFLRPRRFGKSLFTSMLECYYDCAMSDEFDELFQGTYIYNHPTVKHNRYYILKFDFSGLNSSNLEELKAEFHNLVYRVCRKFIMKYELDIALEKGTSAADCLSDFLDNVEIAIKDKSNNLGIYVIADEYDYFANELLSFDFNNYSEIISENGYVRKFYEILKKGTMGIVSQIFITGVSPITMDSMTSGFNISTNLTLDSDYNEMLGFSTEEMRQLISMVDSIKNPDEILHKMEQIYDGYLFAKDSEEHLYNPNMVLYYLDSYQKKHKEPDELIDPNIYSDYKKIENLLNIKPRKEHSDALLHIITEGEISCRLTLSYNLQKDFSRDDFVSLLYYLGFLTIKGSSLDLIVFKAPNDVTRTVYFEYFNEMLRQNYQVYTQDYAEAVRQLLLDHKNDQLVACAERTLATLDNRDFVSFNERIVKTILTSILTPTNFMLIKNEYPVEKGYIDLALFPKNIIAPIMLIELKYIKKEDLSEQILQDKRKEAIDQLQNYHCAKEFEGESVIKWILIFSKDKCVLNERVD